MADDEREIELDRRGGLKSAGAHAARLMRPLARQRGTATARLAAEWPAIVGPEIARHSLPERLAGGQGRPAGAQRRGAAPPAGGTLRLRVEGPLALELQHLAPQIIERINSYFGYAAVGRLQIVQGPLPRRIPPAQANAPLDPQGRQDLRARLASVADDGLRAALERLGQAILSRKDM
jgi:hypothetical protein